MDKALELLKKCEIIKDDYIVVGCSSGADSMCLLHLLKSSGYRVICAHVNHSIREESADEYEYLEKFCGQNDITFEGLVLEKTNQNESYYRKKRYDFYKSLAQKYSTKYIATAHHADDLMETVLMRISRGSNLKGYVGFQDVYEEKGYVFLKPLLKYTKEEIIAYDDKNKVKYFEDYTNLSDDYTRNRYRHNVIPFLKSENGRVHEKYLEYSKELSDAYNYISKVASEAMTENYKQNRLDLTKFFKLDDYIKKCELEIILSQVFGDDIDKVSKRHVRDILKLLKTGKNFEIDLPKNFIVKREYDLLVIEAKKINTDYYIKLTDRHILENGDMIELTKSSDDNSNYTTRLNSKDLSLPLYIRNRCEGDRMEIKNLNGSKKIKEIMIDEKVTPSRRAEWPVVVDQGGTVVWLPGLKKSKFDNEKSGKYDIILKYVRKEKIDEEQ